MEWLIEGDVFKARAIEYTEQGKFFNQLCPHWGEPRLLKRETLRPDREGVEAEKIEVLNPWLEAADLAMAAVRGMVAGQPKLKELDPFDSLWEAWSQRPVSGGYELGSYTSRRVGEDEWIYGQVVLTVRPRDGVWRVESVRFVPSKP